MLFIEDSLVENVNEYADVELLFSATKGKLFIDVVYYRHLAKPYYIYAGLSKNKYLELTYNLNKPVNESNEFYFQEIDDVVQLINFFLTELDYVFMKKIQNI